MTETKDNATQLSFPSTLASDAGKGGNHIRIAIMELQNAATIIPYVIHLHSPIGFVVTDAGSYGSIEKGMMGAGMDAILQKIGVKSGDQTGLTEADIKAAASTNTSLLGNFPGLDMLDRGARIKAMEAGIAVNPNTHVTYDGHGLRSFQLDFKLISESTDEAKTIAKIVDVLRNYSMPESTGAVSIQYPAKFELEFYKGDKINKFMPKMIHCHLTSLGTTYNTTSNIFHADGAPLETDISLQFQEIRVLTRQDLYGEDFEGIDSNETVVGG